MSGIKKLLFAAILTALVASAISWRRTQLPETSSAGPDARDSTTIEPDQSAPQFGKSAPALSSVSNPVPSLLAQLLAIGENNWSASLREQLARMPISEQVAILLNPGFTGRRDAGRWAGQIQLLCGLFMLDTVNRTGVIPEFQMSACAGLADDARLLKAKLTELELSVAIPEDNTAPDEWVPRALELLHSDDAYDVHGGIQDLLRLRATDALGVELPTSVRVSVERNIEVSTAAGALVACTLDGYCGATSPWVSQYCSWPTLRCQPGASLDAQIAANMSPNELALVRSLVDATFRARRRKQ